MTTRTIQILGQGYGASPATITATANGNTVFSGTVNTLDQPPPPLHPASQETVDSTVVLFTFDTDTDFTGQIPMTCVVNSGTVVFAQVFANYTLISNPVYTPEQLNTIGNIDTPQATRVAIYSQEASPPLSQAEIDILLDPAATPEEKQAILVTHNCEPYKSSGASGYASVASGDPRENVTIDGIPDTPDQPLDAAWWWKIDANSTLAYDLDVEPASV